MSEPRRYDMVLDEHGNSGAHPTWKMSRQTAGQYVPFIDYESEQRGHLAREKELMEKVARLEIAFRDALQFVPVIETRRICEELWLPSEKQEG